MTTSDVIEQLDQQRRTHGRRWFFADLVMLLIVGSMAIAVIQQPQLVENIGDKSPVVQAEGPTPESNLDEIEKLRDQNARQAQTILELQDRLDACTNGQTVDCLRPEPYSDDVTVVPVREDSDADGGSDTTVVVRDNDPQPTPRDTTPPRVSTPITDDVVKEIRENLDDTLNLADQVTDTPLLDDLPVELGGR